MFFKKKEQRSIDEILNPKDKVEQENDFLEDDKNSEYFAEDENDFTDNALKCFGWKEDKTEKWLVKCTRFWYGIMSFIWFLFGATTFAPIIFISTKVNAIFKNKKKSLFCATAIYVFIFGIVAFLIFLK